MLINANNCPHCWTPLLEPATMEGCPYQHGTSVMGCPVATPNADICAHCHGAKFAPTESGEEPCRRCNGTGFEPNAENDPFNDQETSTQPFPPFETPNAGEGKTLIWEKQDSGIWIASNSEFHLKIWKDKTGWYYPMADLGNLVWKPTYKHTTLDIAKSDAEAFYAAISTPYITALTARDSKIAYYKELDELQREGITQRDKRIEELTADVKLRDMARNADKREIIRLNALLEEATGVLRHTQPFFQYGNMCQVSTFGSKIDAFLTKLTPQPKNQDAQG